MTYATATTSEGSQKRPSESIQRINNAYSAKTTGINYVKYYVIPVEGLIILPIGDELLTAWSLCACHIPPHQMIALNPSNLAPRPRHLNTVVFASNEPTPFVPLPRSIWFNEGTRPPPTPRGGKDMQNNAGSFTVGA